MIVYYDPNRTYPEPRLYPYEAANPTQRGFIDFAKTPELIETTLEDFIPFAHTNAVRVFYDFLRWINGPSSCFVTSDCAMRPPAPHNDRNSNHTFNIHGRVFILFRDLALNSSLLHSDWLCVNMMQKLQMIDLNFPASKGVVGFTKQLTLQTAISKGRWYGNGFGVDEGDPGFGHHLMLSFWAYGDTEEETFGNLESVFKNLWAASRLVSESRPQLHGSNGKEIESDNMTKPDGGKI